MPKKRLNITVDAAVVERARRYTRRHNTSISGLVSEFLAHLPDAGGEEAEDLSPVLREIVGVLQTGDEYLDVDQACCALAACEVVARLLGNWGQRDAYSEPLDLWVETYANAHPGPLPPDLVQGALAAIDRITRPPSELLELWQEDDPQEWLAAVADLRSRVGA